MAKLKFKGQPEALRALVAANGYNGQWEEAGGRHTFAAQDGAILNWWPTTGTVHCQGDTAAAKRLEDVISGALSTSGAIETAPIAPLPATAPAGKESDSRKVFVVHGHDKASLEQLELILMKLKLEPVILTRQAGEGLTIFEELEREIVSSGTRCSFAIVLLTPDDIGYPKDAPGKAEPRARQNVVLELGMLLGALTRGRVAILRKGHLEDPSDTQALKYIAYNDHVRECVPLLAQRLV